jgi:hypothetical protein
VVDAAGIESVPLDFLPHRGNLCGQEATVPHLSPTTLTTDEQRLIRRATYQGASRYGRKATAGT